MIRNLMKICLLAQLMCVTLIATASAQSKSLAPVDLDSHCQKHYGLAALNLDGTGYGWRCGTEINISVDNACREQYGPASSSMLVTVTPGGTNDWRCWKDEPASVKPAVQADGAASVDLDRYCQKHYGLAASNLDGTGYGWRCGTEINISVDTACQEQYGPASSAILITAPPGGMNDWRCRTQKTKIQ